MKDLKDKRSQRESILIALDQMSQTIDVMTHVVEKLRDHFIRSVPSKNTRSAAEQSSHLHKNKINHTIH